MTGGASRISPIAAGKKRYFIRVSLSLPKCGILHGGGFA
jgi:hypothetical protein